MASSCAAMSSAAATSDSRCSSFCAATRRPRSSSSVSGHSASPAATGSYEFKRKDYDGMTLCMLKHQPALLVQLQHLKDLALPTAWPWWNRAGLYSAKLDLQVLR